MDENYLSYEIEFMYGSYDKDIRDIYWRIKPYQLNWFQRHFCNRWRPLYRCCIDEWNPYFSAEIFVNEVKPCKTVADIEDYIKKQQKLIDAHNPWPKNPNK